MALIDNLISYYKCDENAANTTVADSHGSNTGTASTNTSNLYDASGKINSAFDLNGSNERVDFGTSELVGDNYTVNFWVNTGDITTSEYGPMVVLEKGLGFNIMWNQIQKLEVGQRGTNLSVNYSITTGDFIDTWKMITVVVDLTEGSVINKYNTYIDGSLYTTGKELYSRGGEKHLNVIGTDDYGNWLNGKMDEVGIWNRALTSTEVSELYNSGAGLAYPFSVATLRLIKIAGTFVDKPILTKVAGTFVDKPIQIKVGGTFQDA